MLSFLPHSLLLGAVDPILNSLVAVSLTLGVVDVVEGVILRTIASYVSCATNLGILLQNAITALMLLLPRLAPVLLVLLVTMDSKPILPTLVKPLHLTIHNGTLTVVLLTILLII